MTPFLAADGLVRHFRSKAHPFAAERVVRAVDGVSLAIARGETLAVVGESGCGKSTLGRLILRLIEPDSGRITFDGQEITTLQGEALRALRGRMQIVFQDPFASLNPRMTAGAIVGEPLVVHGIGHGADRKQRTAELMRLVGLRPEHASRYPHEFSGGQRQRIGIARALASGPTFLVGDEPVSALDVSIQAQVVNLLEDLKDRLGLTVMFISHDLAVVRHVADRVAVMYLGEIVEIAPTEALYEAPLHPYTHALLASVPVRHPADRRPKSLISGDVPSPSRPPSGCRFHTRCPHVKPVCREAKPPPAAVSDGRIVACHLWREVAAAGSGAPLAATAVPGARARRMAIYAAAAKRYDTGTTAGPQAT